MPSSMAEGNKRAGKIPSQNETNATSHGDQDAEKPSVADFMCPICLQLLMEPVVMPCRHELCMPCFQAHVQSTSLCCPMCRIRISNWARKRSRKEGLIDKQRWEYIQKLFPERCKRRLNGEDEEDDDIMISGKLYFMQLSTR